MERSDELSVGCPRSREWYQNRMSLKSRMQSLEKEIYLIYFQNSELAKRAYLMRRSTLKIGRDWSDWSVLTITNVLRVADTEQKSHLLLTAVDQETRLRLRQVGVKCEWLDRAPQFPTLRPPRGFGRGETFSNAACSPREEATLNNSFTQIGRYTRDINATLSCITPCPRRTGAGDHSQCIAVALCCQHEFSGTLVGSTNRLSATNPLPIVPHRLLRLCSYSSSAAPALQISFCEGDSRRAPR